MGQACLAGVVRDCQSAEEAGREEQSRGRTPAGLFLQRRLLRVTSSLRRDWTMAERRMRQEEKSALKHC